LRLLAPLTHHFLIETSSVLPVAIQKWLTPKAHHRLLFLKTTFLLDVQELQVLN
jgi:hypothetical protein